MRMNLLQIIQQYTVTSQYGPRIDPITKKPGQFHTGIDLIGKEVNDPIESFAEGDVIYSGDTFPGTGLGGYGWVVMVKDRYGNGYLYAHLQKQSLKVKVGDHVVTGQELGIMGSTGRSTGKHLHFEVRRNPDPRKSWGLGTHTNPFAHLVELCQQGWLYYNKLNRKDMCDMLHEAAELLRTKAKLPKG